MIVHLPAEVGGPCRAVEVDEFHNLTAAGWKLVAMIETTIIRSVQKPHPHPGQQPNGYYNPESIFVNEPVPVTLFVVREDPESALAKMAEDLAEARINADDWQRARSDLANAKAGWEKEKVEADKRNERMAADLIEEHRKRLQAEDAPRRLEVVLAKARKALGELAWKEIEK